MNAGLSGIQRAARVPGAGIHLENGVPLGLVMRGRAALKVDG